MAFVNYYELLDIPHGADSESVRQAVRKHRREWRNRSAHPKAETRALAEKMTQHISDAEGVLVDPARRADYDRQLAAQLAAPERQDTGPVPASGGRDWASIIRQYLAAGDPSRANYAAREATIQEPDNAEVWYLRGASSALLQNQDEAKFELGEALRLDPSNAAYHAELGDLYASAEQWGRAQEHYQRASELEPQNKYYQVGVASMYSAQGRPDLALPTLEAAVEESPDTEFFRYHLAVALTDHVTDQWSKFGDGSRTILTEAQLQASKKALARVEALHVDDPQLRVELFDIRRLVEDAEEVRWRWESNSWIAYLVGLWISFALTFAIVESFLVGLVGLAAGAAVVYFAIQRHRGPGWQWNRRGASDFVRSTGLQ
ncbi:J domain-containing protein [Kocuria atrinae]|uniref:J domain-containing protein n=1 Tax=Kocuria atrinae TaxID=592377 RepID=A0ABN2Y0W0_9MICC